MSPDEIARMLEQAADYIESTIKPTNEIEAYVNNATYRKFYDKYIVIGSVIEG